MVQSQFTRRGRSTPHPASFASHTLADIRVWARFHGDELIVTAVDPGSGTAAEVARHRRGSPGSGMMRR